MKHIETLEANLPDRDIEFRPLKKGRKPRLTVTITSTTHPDESGDCKATIFDRGRILTHLSSEKPKTVAEFLEDVREWLRRWKTKAA